MRIYVNKVRYLDRDYYTSNLFSVHKRIIGLSDGIQSRTKTYTSKINANAEIVSYKRRLMSMNDDRSWALVYLSDKPPEYIARDSVDNWHRKISNHEAIKIIETMEVLYEDNAIQFSDDPPSRKIGLIVSKNLHDPCKLCGLYPNEIPILKGSRICIFCIEDIMKDGKQLMNANLTIDEISKIKRERLIRKLKE